MEPLLHAGGSPQHSDAGLCTQLPARTFLSASSAPEEELSRTRHAWQELPPELIALIFQRASVRERKLCEAPWHLLLLPIMPVNAQPHVTALRSCICSSEVDSIMGVAGRLVCKGWRRGVDTLVTRLQVGPNNRDQQVWNRQLLMLQKLPALFPCLREIDFDQVPLTAPVHPQHLASTSLK